MKRWIELGTLLLACNLSALASIVQHGSVSGNGSSATLTATQKDDIIVECGNRNSNTEPAVPTGYITIKHATGANTQSGTCAYKSSPGNEITLGTMTNASNVAYFVVRGVQIQSGGILGCNPAQSNGSSTSLTYPTCTMSRTDGSSILVTFGTATGAVTNLPDSCPTGPGGGTMTLQSSTSQSSLALCTLVGATSATTINSVTIDNTGHCGFTFEILGTTKNTAITANDYLVYSKPWRYTNEAASSPYTMIIPLEHISESGNDLDVTFAWQYASVAPTVSNVYCNSDTGGATWAWALTTDGTRTARVLDTGDTTDIFNYSVHNAASGCTKLTIVASSAFVTAAVTYREFRQIASSPVEYVAAQTSTSDPFQTAGAITTATTGDLIYQDCSSATMGGVGGATGVTTIDKSEGITMLGDWPLYNLGSEAWIYGTTGADTEYMAFLPAAGNHAVCIAVALKVSAGAGTAPTGPQIVSSWNVLMTGVATNTNPYAIMSTGDSIFIVDDGNQVANAQQFTGLTDTIGNSFAVKAPFDGSAGYPSIAFDCNVTAGDDLLIFTGVNTGATHNQWLVEMRNLDNSSHTACWDSTTGVGGCSGGHCVSGTPTAIVASTASPTGLPSITPGTADGIVFANSEIGNGTPQSLSAPTCGVFDNDTYAGQTDQSRMGLGNFFGFCLNSSTSAQSWGWVNGTSDTYQSIGIHFKAPAASNVTPAIWVIQP